MLQGKAEPPMEDSLELSMQDSLELPMEDSLELPMEDSLEPPMEDSLESINVARAMSNIVPSSAPTKSTKSPIKHPMADDIQAPSGKPAASDECDDFRNAYSKIISEAMTYQPVLAKNMKKKKKEKKQKEDVVKTGNAKKKQEKKVENGQKKKKNTKDAMNAQKKVQKKEKKQKQIEKKSAPGKKEAMEMELSPSMIATQNVVNFDIIVADLYEPTFASKQSYLQQKVFGKKRLIAAVSEKQAANHVDVVRQLLFYIKNHVGLKKSDVIEKRNFFLADLNAVDVN